MRADGNSIHMRLRALEARSVETVLLIMVGVATVAVEGKPQLNQDEEEREQEEKFSAYP